MGGGMVGMPGDVNARSFLNPPPPVLSNAHIRGCAHDFLVFCLNVNMDSNPQQYSSGIQKFTKLATKVWVRQSTKIQSQNRIQCSTSLVNIH